MKKMIALKPVVLCPEGFSSLAARAVEVFLQEVQLHTGLALTTTPCPMTGVSNVIILPQDAFAKLYPDKKPLLDRYPVPGAEGYRLFFEVVGGKRMNLYAIGADARGTFFAMGKLLRLLRLTKGELAADMLFEGMSETPKYAMRGHQFGYRDKQNTLPCWTSQQFDRYMRDMAIFGSNSVEWLPPRTDDNLFSREMQADPFDVMLEAAKSADSYGLDFWLWYPNMGHDYSDPACCEAEWKEREQVFSAIPHIAGVLVPAGDPGDLHPNELFPVTEKVASILHKYHPEAKLMLAPQCFAPEPGWYDAFYAHVAREPEWLYGVSFAPWEMDSIQAMVEKLPEKYKNRIRHYPDVTHDMGCQFAQPNRDPAFAIIEGRECCDPRPRAMKIIHNYYAPYCMGSITYSEGVHDDVNKFVWGDQDWDSTKKAESTVREYVRYFIDPALEEDLTKLILLLEDNWYANAKIADIPSVEKAWQLILDTDRKASEAVKTNWRYQQLLLRALADHYIQEKQAYDTALEEEARAVLAKAPEMGAVEAIRAAFDAFDRGVDEPCDPALRSRLLQLGDALRRSIGMKLTTHHHGGQRWGRGAWLDMIDTPLNDAPYFRVEMKKALRLETEEEKLAVIDKLLNRTTVGEGEVYVDMGSVESRPMVITQNTWKDDPQLLHTPFTTVSAQSIDLIHTWMGTWKETAVPKALHTCAISYYDTPLTIRVDGLQDGVAYDMTIAHASGRPGRCKGGVRLTAGDIVIAEDIGLHNAGKTWYTYHLPASCIKDGAITLTWQPYGQVAGVHVQEIFFTKPHQ